MKENDTKISVLIIDDEAEICRLLADALKPKPYRIRVTTNGKKSLDIIREMSPDIVIADLKLPGVSGIRLLEAAKENDPYCEVIIITGYATVESASQATQKGAISYLLKPISIPDFITQVERARAQKDIPPPVEIGR